MAVSPRVLHPLETPICGIVSLGFGDIRVQQGKTAELRVVGGEQRCLLSKSWDLMVREL